MKLDNIKLSQKAKGQLLNLKRKTKIKNWNILCRWGFCLSLADPSKPKEENIPSDSSIEMTWKVFGGQYHNIYMALLKQRCNKDEIELSEEALYSEFKLHLHRGIQYLAADSNLKDISTLLVKALDQFH